MWSLAEIVRSCADTGLSFPETVMARDSERSGMDPRSIREIMDSRLVDMERSVKEALSGDPRGKFVGGDAALMGAYGAGHTPLSGTFAVEASRIALAVSTYNASMGRIVAAPTAGSCGILPGMLFGFGSAYPAPRERLVEALTVAGGIGQVIARRATLAGATGGCQAECGAAAAMGASALVFLQGGSPEAISHAAALTIKSIMGLVCDPVAGLVEIPCVKRNGSLVALGAICADMALAGIRSAIPPDEVIDAMRSVGHSLPESLRETGTGGIAATPTGIRMKEALL
ncbi:MAG: L-serine ammonia-lyase, iron-sulfur-dependent, subunit alpha [Thermovirgaceae bacterium]|nr:L-serine ammonia-lyase, iron-sulfur-dependent, subunit alpha [Thermovirgaceae bacterium]